MDNESAIHVKIIRKLYNVYVNMVENYIIAKNGAYSYYILLEDECYIFGDVSSILVIRPNESIYYFNYPIIV